MDRLEAISVDVTTEEMVVLLEQMGSDSYAGLDSSGLDDLSERERALVLDVARRGLIARRFLTKDEAGEWQVDPYALAAVGISLAPARSVMVIRGQNRDSATSYLFHTAQDVFVIHEVVENGSHQFLVVRDGETWQKSIFSAAGIDQDVSRNGLPDASQTAISPAVLNDAYERAQAGSPNEAEARLIQHGVGRDTAKSLVTTLAGPVTFSTVVAIKHTPEEQRDDVTILTGGNDCWLLEMSNGQGDGGGEGQFNMTRLSIEDARNRLAALTS